MILPPEVDYVWGDAIAILDEWDPDVRMINLETAVTTSSTPWPHKGINYRMHPGNLNVLSAAKIDCAVLSNNHILDWSYAGLTESLSTLAETGIRTVGAGESLPEAQAPATFDVGPHLGSDHADSKTASQEEPGPRRPRVHIFGLGHSSSGIPYSWRAGGRAGSRSGGINLIEFDNAKDFKAIKADVSEAKQQSGDIAVVSIHWGSNWDWDLESGQERFAHRLIDEAGVDLVHGHSSHHIKGVEVYHGKLIAWGCGDFLSDYEGIGGVGGPGWHGEFRDSLSFMYFVDLHPATGDLLRLSLVPMRLKHVQVGRARGGDREWLFENMRRECRKWGGDLEAKGDHFALVLP